MKCNSQPLITIITVSKNSAKTILDTLDSVRLQTYPFIEHILVDAFSGDGTGEIIHNYLLQFPKATLISNSGKGIYRAMNKGVRRAKGDYIGFLNADDFYIDNHVIQQIVDTIIKDKQPDIVYGDLLYVDAIDTDYVVRYWNAGHFRPYKMLFGWMAPHPTLFVKKELLMQHGLFDETLSFSADYEMMIRFFNHHKKSVTYIPKVLVKMRTGGIGNKSFNNRLKANREDRVAWKKNGYWLPRIYFTSLCKPLGKIFQFLPYLKKRLLLQKPASKKQATPFPQSKLKLPENYVSLPSLLK